MKGEKCLSLLCARPSVPLPRAALSPEAVHIFALFRLNTPWKWILISIQSAAPLPVKVIIID